MKKEILIKCRYSTSGFVEVIDKNSKMLGRLFEVKGCRLCYKNNQVVYVKENELFDGMNVDHLIDVEMYKWLKEYK